MRKKTFWLVVQSATTGKIDPQLSRRVDGRVGEAEAAAASLRLQLGRDYLVTTETDKQARLYKSYKDFQGTEDALS